MAEYVSKVELKERIRYDFDYSLQLCEDIIESIDSMLAINNVHCENCIHYFPDDEEENFGECFKLRDNVRGDDATSVYVDGNFFCKFGERKEQWLIGMITSENCKTKYIKSPQKTLNSNAR